MITDLKKRKSGTIEQFLYGKEIYPLQPAAFEEVSVSI